MTANARTPLMPPDLERRFAEVGLQADVEDAGDVLIVARYFNPAEPGEWLCCSYSPSSRIVDCYARLGLGFDEWGAMSLDELAAYEGPTGQGILRDVLWTERPFRETNAFQERNRGDD